MFFTLLIISVYFTLVSAYNPCGEPAICTCGVDLGVALCSGDNITSIPRFEELVLKNTIFLDIINTMLFNLTTLNLDEWPRLEYITFRSNMFLTCTNIYDFIRSSNNTIHVDHACHDTKKQSSQKSKYHLQYLWLISLITLFVPILGIIKKKLRAMTSSDDDEENDVSNIDPINFELEGFKVVVQCDDF